jgi:hypothetical protein
MRADNNSLHPLFAPNCCPLSACGDANAVIKAHYPHMRVRITILGYTDAVINCICNPFIYIYIIRFTKMRSFCIW